MQELKNGPEYISEASTEVLTKILLVYLYFSSYLSFIIPSPFQAVTRTQTVLMASVSSLLMTVAAICDVCR